MKRQIILVVHNVRSCHNVGSLLRTAEGLGIDRVYLTGYTPYPNVKNDKRLPYIAAAVTKKITKTALGAETLINWQQQTNVYEVLAALKMKGYDISALEQTDQAYSLPDFQPTSKIALIVGNELHGVEQKVLDITDYQLKIPMLGKKESFNVAQATAMSLYFLRFYPTH